VNKIEENLEQLTERYKDVVQNPAKKDDFDSDYLESQSSGNNSENDEL